MSLLGCQATLTRVVFTLQLGISCCHHILSYYYYLTKQCSRPGLFSVGYSLWRKCLCRCPRKLIYSPPPRPHKTDHSQVCKGWRGSRMGRKGVWCSDDENTQHRWSRAGRASVSANYTWKQSKRHIWFLTVAKTTSV